MRLRGNRYRLCSGGIFVSVGFGSSGGTFEGAEYLNRRNITYRGSFGRILWSTWDLLTVLIAEGKLDLSEFVTHRFPLEEFEEAIRVLSGDSCKVVILPQQ